MFEKNTPIMNCMRTEVLKAENRSQRPRVGSGSWLGDLPPHQPKGLGSAVSSLSGAQGTAPDANAFWAQKSPENA